MLAKLLGNVYLLTKMMTNHHHHNDQYDKKNCKKKLWTPLLC